MSRDRLILLGVCLLATIVFLNTLPNGFALDDEFIILRNAQVHGIDALPDAVTGAYWPLGPARLGMYRPVTLATFAIDWEIWQGRAFGFHLVNVLLHVATTALTFLLLLRLGSGRLAAAGAAAVFAVHPVHVEAVANIVGRAEVLAALFFLLACLAYLRMRRGWWTATVIALLYLLSLLSKEIGVTLPGALLLLHAARGQSIREALMAARMRWRVYAGLAVSLVAYFVLRWVNIGAVLGGGEAAWFLGEPPATRVWTAIRIFPEYLRLMLVPLDLVPDYGPAVIVPEQAWSSPLVLLGLLTAAAMAAVVVLAWNRSRLLSVGILWFCGTVLPVSGLFFETGVLLAERTLYLPSVGLALAAAGVLDSLRVAYPRRRPLVVAVLALLVAMAAVRTWVQNPVWRSTDTVVRHLMETHPGNYRAQWLLALMLSGSGEKEAALNHFRLALRMVPGYYNLRTEYGRELFQLGRYAEAAEQYDMARRITPDIHLAHARYVESLLMDGRTAEALAAAEEAVELFPETSVMHHLHAQTLTKLGRFEEARHARARTLALDRGSVRWALWYNLAALEVTTGRPAAAAAALDSARTYAPDDIIVPDPAELEAWLSRGETSPIPYW